MRIAIVTESFLPTVNGVSHSVARIAEELLSLGHEVLIVAPGRGPTHHHGARVVRTAAVPLPGYLTVPVGVPSTAAASALAAFRPDVVHVGGPVALGAWGVRQAGRLDLPIVAVYQTDFARFARHYRLARAEQLAWRWLRRIHSRARITLAPSAPAVRDLRRNGIPRVRRWGRGVDLQRFSPQCRDARLRRRLAADGELIVGFMGRLAPEKQLGLLRAVRGLPGTRLVVVGDGPDRDRLRRSLPRAVFTGELDGADLAQHVASFDIFVHPGANETFCQAVQEGLACGVPVVAPAAGGLVDLVTDGVNGLVFRPGDARDLRRAVRTLLADDAARRRMGRNARAGVEGRSWRAVTLELLAHHRDAIAYAGHEEAGGTGADGPGGAVMRTLEGAAV